MHASQESLEAQVAQVTILPINPPVPTPISPLTTVCPRSPTLGPLALPPALSATHSLGPPLHPSPFPLSSGCTHPLPCLGARPFSLLDLPGCGPAYFYLQVRASGSRHLARPCLSSIWPRLQLQPRPYWLWPQFSLVTSLPSAILGLPWWLAQSVKNPPAMQ